MTLFSYKAVNAEGVEQEGTKEAKDEATVVRLLQEEGCIPVKVSQAGLKSAYLFSFKRDKEGLTQKDIGLFTKELATLLQAGLPIDRSLVVLMDLIEEDSKIHRLIKNVLEQVKGGVNLADALQSESSAFSRFYINMLRAGEAGGSVDIVLGQLSEYIEKSKELKDTVSTAMIYPIILVVMAVGSVFLLLTFVVPQFTEMFESAGKELPISTQIVVGTAEWLQSYWWVLFTLGTGTYFTMRYELSIGPRKAKWDRAILSLPLVGEIIRNMSTTNFTRTLGTLLANGVPILTALGIVKGTISNLVLVQALTEAEENLKQGKDMSSALIESGQFPKMATQMIKMGEETGKMEEMLERTANTYDKQLKITIERMLAMMEPLLIVTLGLLIAGIIISILSAILSVNDLAF
ncbi:general secretion pathway protein F [Bathymodiolus platifrons methanotrophic gill symbiont]|uniref:type II secretion system F family protein n=1 Tax=Bathymodiolus platifrons methanotrophic gill symbiont TaxID=113268 RepID=UPI000B76078B|nr:type II secretion system F family protein [Bathymodiolus platifrons methanotrophic gill symbiont]MCK5869624.1 type II secretion system F family protein [Methyloprofundus sp.]GAW86046.1 general secretion pathway protein F [Bathymodiolus platifrons methanotrophic gill symbiont]GFO76312.1 general secretion pathway protein F [Bathymodiolus platifrons methanotrophic gill symbiont]